MLDQDKIRDDLKIYLKENGIKAKFIAKKLELSEAMLSYFINNKHNLSPIHLKKLSKILYKYPL